MRFLLDRSSSEIKRQLTHGAIVSIRLNGTICSQFLITFEVIPFSPLCFLRPFILIMKLVSDFFTSKIRENYSKVILYNENLLKISINFVQLTPCFSAKVHRKYQSGYLKLNLPSRTIHDNEIKDHVGTFWVLQLLSLATRSKML